MTRPEPREAKWLGRHVVIASTNGQEPERPPNLTSDERRIRRIVIREAVSFILVVLGLAGVAVSATVLWGIWGLYLAIAVLAIVIGFAIGG